MASSVVISKLPFSPSGSAGWSPRPFARAAGEHLVKSSVVGFQDGIPAGESLPAPYSNIDIAWVDFDAECVPSDLLRRHDRAAGAGKGIDDDRSASRAIPHGVGDHGYRFHGRMHLQVFHPTSAERIGARVAPDIAASSPMLPKFKCVEVRRLAPLVDEDQFVLAAIKAALPGRGFCLNADILQFVVCRCACLEQFARMAPIHTDVGDAAVNDVICAHAQRVFQKLLELTGSHFAGSAHKLPMLDPASTADMTLHFHIVRRVKKGHVSSFGPH
jgi:hypothetical protein